MRGPLLVATAATAFLFAAACGAGGGSEADTLPGATTTTTIDISARVKVYVVTGHNHVQDPVDYPQKPPVGGDHAPRWQNCGFYSQSVPSEQAVHSMEHGAVWITFRPDLPDDQVRTLRAFARANPYVLVSPWADTSLPAPVVASAWGLQLTADSATDPAIGVFVRRYANGPQAPEPGAPCSGGVGTPG